VLPAASPAGKRVEGEQTGEVTARILSSFLTEMDGLELAQGVLVMGATNRPQALDAALIRPGRFDVLLYVPPPDEPGRLQALQVS
jgi:SpoVK/Ycf46/Vps4 family AAA+-type ATPase